jgi:hypothetical protein
MMRLILPALIGVVIAGITLLVTWLTERNS